MNESVLVALIGLIGSGFGSLCGVLVSSRLTQYRIEQLEKKVQAHNNLVERMYDLERRETGLEQALVSHEQLYAEKIRVANHRIEDLERSYVS